MTYAGPQGGSSRLRRKARELGREVETRVQPQGRNKPLVLLVQFSQSNGNNGHSNGDGDGAGSWK